MVFVILNLVIWLSLSQNDSFEIVRARKEGIFSSFNASTSIDNVSCGLLKLRACDYWTLSLLASIVHHCFICVFMAPFLKRYEYDIPYIKQAQCNELILQFLPFSNFLEIYSMNCFGNWHSSSKSIGICSSAHKAGLVQCLISGIPYVIEIDIWIVLEILKSHG